jgi:hypothetical protein
LRGARPGPGSGVWSNRRFALYRARLDAPAMPASKIVAAIYMAQPADKGSHKSPEIVGTYLRCAPPQLTLQQWISQAKGSGHERSDDCDI